MFYCYDKQQQVKTMIIFIIGSCVVIVGFTKLKFPSMEMIFKENNAIRTLFINGTDLNASTVLPHRDLNLPKSNFSKDFLLNERKYISQKESRGNDISIFKIGILIPSSTRNIKSPALNKLSLTNICIPSIFKFMEKKYDYFIYVGIDKGDYLETVKHEFEAMFTRIKVIVTPGRTFTKAVNAIAREAYKDGMDYLVRINDDTTFESRNWTSQGIKVLQNFSPPNIGIVGPTCRQGNTGILTHDMVHRTHLEIFDFYYPPYFDNWWADDWITKVYQPNRTTKLLTWIVKHHLSVHNSRYKVKANQLLRLEKTLTFDKERLLQYLESRNQY